MFSKKLISAFNPYKTTTTGGNHNSLVFDGTDDYIQTNNAMQHGEHTLIFWVKINATSGDQILFDNRDSDNDGICLKINSDEKIEYQLNDQDLIGAGDLEGHMASGVLVTDVWHHIVVTHDGNFAKIMLNGLLIAQETATSDHDTSVNASSYATIGKSRLGSSGYLNGSISEAVMFSTGAHTYVANHFFNNGESFDYNNIPAPGWTPVFWYTFGDGALDDTGTRNVRGIIKDNSWAHRINGAELYTQSNAIAIGSHTNAATGWTASSGHVVSSTSSASKISYGSYSLKCIFAIGGSGTIHTTFPAVAGKIYKIRFLSRGAVWADYGDSISDLHIQVGNAAGNGGSFNEGLFTDIDSGKFYSVAEMQESTSKEIVFFCRVVAVDGSDNAYLTLNHVGSNGSGTLWLGGLSITEVTGSSGELLNRTTSFTPDPPDSPN